MTKITETFARLRQERQKALIPFITAGDPNLHYSRELLISLPRAGADLIELGVPFSDPMADGPTIQRASARGLASGAQLPAILKLLRGIRSQIAAPIVLFGYYNPFFRFGVERLAREAKAAGVDGLLIVDVPPEEAGEVKGALDDADLDLIFLLSPVSDRRRAESVLAYARGFVYYVSVTGVTGARTELPPELGEQVKTVKALTELPVCVGFGISEPEQARAVAMIADGVVVGSALVARIEKLGASPAMLHEAVEFTSRLKKALS